MSVGVVRSFDVDAGWGVIDGEQVPGGCWVHFSAIAADGFRQLTAGQAVAFRFETPGQDGFAFRAVKVWATGAEPADVPPAQDSSGAYSSTLTLTFDPDPADGAGDSTVWDAARTWRAWLDERNGTRDLELTLRIAKIAEESGEAVQAWIGVLGQNPRKGVTHTREDVAGELADVAFTALVAIESLGFDARTVLEACAAKAAGYLPPGAAS